MWLDNLKELKTKTMMTTKQIAEKANLPEKTVIRILQGATSDPRVDTVRRIVAAMGGSLDDIFAESGAIIGDQKLASLQEELYQVTVELSGANSELAIIKNTNAALMAENELLRQKLDHKDELLAHKEKIISLYSQVERLREEHQ
jgi:predicted transcriptional regulator